MSDAIDTLDGYQRACRRVVASVLIKAVRAGRAYREAERAYEAACEAVEGKHGAEFFALQGDRMNAAYRLDRERARLDAALEAAGE